MSVTQGQNTTIMNPSILLHITYKFIFQVVFKNLDFNLPRTFFVLSTLRLIPQDITKNIFSQILAKDGQVRQIISLYSYNPNRLKKYIKTIPIMRWFFVLNKTPIKFRLMKKTRHIFLYRLKSVERDFMSYFGGNGLICKISHIIRIQFSQINIGNETLLIHNKMNNIYFNFPVNFDMPFFCSNLFEALISAGKEKIVPQPLFIDDRNHVISEEKNKLHLSYTYSCPSCEENIFEYNSLSQQCKKKFQWKKEFAMRICRCEMCTKRVYNPH